MERIAEFIVKSMGMQRRSNHLRMMQSSPRNIEAVCLAGSSLREATTNKNMDISSNSIFSPDFSPVMQPASEVPKDFKQHVLWVKYTEALKAIVQAYTTRVKCISIFSVVCYYAAVAGLPFGILSYADDPLTAHLLYTMYTAVSVCLEGYLCYNFSRTDHAVDELESDVHVKLHSAYPKLLVQEEATIAPTSRVQIAIALLWGQLSRLDTYLHMCFVAILSADEEHPILWGLSLGLILLFLVFYNWTLFVLQSAGNQGISISRVTRHLAAYLEFCGLYLVSSQYCETQAFDTESFELLDLPVSYDKQSEDVSPAVFRYLKWVTEDAAQSVLLVIYLVSEDTDPLIAYSAAMSVLMLLSGLCLLVFRKQFRVLMW